MGAHDQKMKQGSLQAENESEYVCVHFREGEREGERRRREINMSDLGWRGGGEGVCERGYM